MTGSKPARSRKVLLATLALLALGGLWLYGVREAYRSRVPPSNARTLGGFAIRFLDDSEIRCWVFERDDHRFIELTRLLPGWTLPSGGTRYVFTSDGRLVDWVIDDGESDTFWARWGRGPRTPTTLEELLGDR